MSNALDSQLASTVSTIRVLIVDDHSVFRKGLRMLLATDQSIDVIGEAGTAQEALELLAETQPDVISLDIGLPDRSGLELLKVIKQQYPQVRVLILTMHDDLEYTQAALAYGADSYVAKGAADNEYVAAIKAMQQGRMMVSLTKPKPGQTATLNWHPGQAALPNPHLDILSAREREVLILVAQGFTSQQIGDQLFLSTKTIETYRSRLMSKLNFKSRSDLMRYAREHQLLNLSPAISKPG
jgi:two-component system, NarL family, response regulator NreC